MRSALAATLAASSAEEFAQGGTSNLSFSDCGDASTHGKVSGLTPTSITLGQKATVTGSGSVDEAVTGGSFEIDLHASIISKSYTGDLCSSKSLPLPLGTGSLTWTGLKCPIAAGAVSVPVDIALSAALPPTLAAVSMKISGKSSSGDKLLCMNIATKPAAFNELPHPAASVPVPVPVPVLPVQSESSSAGGTLALSFKDCGDASTHGKVTGLTPSTITLGQKTRTTGTGSVDEAVP